ncbi:glycosyltransferase family 2 protein [Clostridium butyricum]|uniref:glycosyltransferase family 2 protein n=1 Tax=Clostridium butyricum TaxID=1492 RepID=UPI003D3546D7
MPKVSIIIPIYNAEKYLEKCLYSIINQTFKDIEIIIINDESQDNSLKICSQFKNMDSRIKLIDKRNEGVSKARNTALDKALGKYIIFVDADDYVDKSMIENMLIKLQDSKADILLCNFINVINGKEKMVRANFDSIITGKNDIFEKVILPLIERNDDEKVHEIAGFRSPWGKLLKKDIIDKFNIRFNENMSIGEDFLFNLQFMSHSDTIAFDAASYYYYVTNNNSALTKYKKNCWNKYYRPIIINLNRFLGENRLYSQAESRVSKLVIKYFFICIYNEKNSGKIYNLSNKYKTIKKMCNDELISQAIRKVKIDDYSKRAKLTLILLNRKMYSLVSIINII